MMKTLLRSTLVVAALVTVPAALAQTTAEQDFDVSVTLTSLCRVVTGQTPEIAFGTYEAFQTAANTDSAEINFECTRNLAISSFTIDSVTSPFYGVIAGLNYELTVAAAAVTAGTAAAAVSNGIGSADILTYTVEGTMPANQVGDDTAPAGPNTHTLLINF
jgi:hypothetical protein